MENQQFSTTSKVIAVASAACYALGVGFALFVNLANAPTIAAALLWTFVDAMFLAIFGVAGTAAIIFGVECLFQMLADGKLKKQEETELDDLRDQTAAAH